MCAKTMRRSASTRTLAALVAAVAGTAATTSDARAGTITYSTIALTGQQAPGMPAGVTFVDVADPRVSPGGQIAYWAKMTGGSITASNDTAIFSNRSGAYQLARQEGAAIDFGTAGDLLLAIPTPVVGNDGFMGFTGAVGTGAANEPTTSAVLLELGALLSELDRETGPTDDLSMAQLTDFGAVTYRRGDGSQIATIEFDVFMHNIHAGNGAPGTGLPNAKFSRLLEPSQNMIERDGFLDADVVFKADITYDAQTAPMFGVWVERDVDPPVMTLVARKGSIASPIDPGATFTEFGDLPRVDTSSRVVFLGRFTPTTGPASAGLFREDAGVLSLIARDHAPAPALPGLTLETLDAVFAVSHSGQVAFGGALSGAGVTSSNNSAIWVAPSNEADPIALIAREGQQAPDTAPGVAFAVLGRPQLSTFGRVAFSSFLSGAGVGPTNNYALFAADGQGTLHLLVRTGQPFTIPGTTTTKTIKDIVFDQGPAQSGLTQYNGAGTLAFRLLFTDFTGGLFTADISSCPADFNNDGFLTGDDYDAFVDEFIAGNLTADFNADGFITGDDFDAFVQSFEAGC